MRDCSWVQLRPRSWQANRGVTVRFLAGLSVVAGAGNLAASPRSTTLGQLSANAGDQPVPEDLRVELDYSASPDCAPAGEFWKAMASRSNRVRRSDTLDAQVVLRVELRTTLRGARGRLQVVQDAVASEPRFVEGSDCRGVLEALALTAVLSLDPDAASRSTPLEADAPSDTAVTEGQSGATSDETTLATQPVLRAPPLSTIADDGPLERDDVDTGPSQPWESSAILAAIGATPVDVGLSLGVGARFALAQAGPSGFSPAVEVGVAHLWSDWTDAEERASFSLTVAELLGCPLRFGGPEQLVRPCLVAQAGILNGSGDNLTNPETTQRFWGAAGAAFQARFEFAAGLGGHLELRGLVPLNRQRYHIGLSPTQVAETPTLVTWFAAGLVFDL